VKRFALIIKQDMLIVCGMQFEPARYTSPVRNHLSQNVATYALRLTVTLRILNCQYKSLAKKKNFISDSSRFCDWCFCKIH